MIPIEIGTFLEVRNPFVSVIVPNYNHSSFLRQRIESILSQTYRDFELIILDDHSTDGSLGIIESFKSHPQVSRVLVNEVNSGSPFRQWHRGIEMARGEWIWIAESDDFCHPEFLQTLISKIANDERMVLAYSQSVEVDENGVLHRNLSHHTDPLNTERWNADYIKEGKDEIRECLFYRNTIPNASAVIFRKSVYAIVSKDYREMKYCGDWMLWTELLYHGRILFSSGALNFFRFHTHSTRNDVSPSVLRAKLCEQYVISNRINLISEGSRRKRQNEIFAAYSRTYKLIHFLTAIFDFRNYRKPVPFFQVIRQRILIRPGRHKTSVSS